jgi:uncharacterized protein YecE (DUF72 family)
MVAEVRVGISGWRYPPWRKIFYPEGLAQTRELEFAAKHFPSVEINGSFYSLQKPEYYANWYDQTPPGFVFAVKGGRFITHMKKLRDVDTALANFFASGVLALRDKLGPILWQFPEQMPADLGRFEAFFASLPRDTAEVSLLARRHAPLMRGRAFIGDEALARAVRPVRHAVELRNPASATPELIALLRRYRIAWVFADTAGRWPYAEDLTSDFVYIRLHGDEALYVSGYSPAAIDRWAARIQCWRRGEEPADACRIAPPLPAAGRAHSREVFVYFDNDVKVHAPFDALALQRALALPPWQGEASLALRTHPNPDMHFELPRQLMPALPRARTSGARATSAAARGSAVKRAAGRKPKTAPTLAAKGRR